MIAPAPVQAIEARAALGGEYLTFALGKEEYGLEILKVREIIGYMDITAVPAPPAMSKASSISEARSSASSISAPSSR